MAPTRSKAERMFWIAASEIRRLLNNGGSPSERLEEIEQLLHDLREDAVSLEAEEASQ